MKNILSHFPKHITFIFILYLLGIGLFTAFRLLLFLTQLDQYHSLPPRSFYLILQAFWMGFRFDTVVSGYILAPPLVILSIMVGFSRGKGFLIRIISIYVGIVYTVAFFICAVDIPYFGYYFSRLTITILNWTQTPGFMVKMVLQEWRYWIYLFAFLASGGTFWYGLFQLKDMSLNPEPSGYHQSKWSDRFRIIGYSLFFCLLTLLGIRGRVAIKSPIRIGTAYFSNYAFPNQLGLNPVFTFFRSYLDELNPGNKKIRLMDDQHAIILAQKYLNIPSSSQFDSPIARLIRTDGPLRKANVIFVLMESMSAERMSRYGNPENLTPNLDSLAKRSYTFDHIYSAGIHTFNGIYSTLFSFPALMKQHPLMQAPILTYTGIASMLKEIGYQTIYFTTHDDQFDNMAGFLRANGFQTIVSQEDYPSEKVMSTLGVPDDYLFEFSIPRLNKLFENRQPFFATFLTASDHGPYLIPTNIPFTPHSNDPKHQVVEYADWSIGKFLTLASNQSWYPNTIFVFLADHGAYLNSIYDMPLSYHHTPLIIYSPSFLHPKSFDSFGGQIDVFPTIMGLINISFVNNTMGIDLLHDRRPYIYFSADDKIGCINDDYFLILRSSGVNSLYRYKNSDTENYFEREPAIVDSMKTYTYSMLQTTQWLIDHQKVGKQSVK